MSPPVKKKCPVCDKFFSPEDENAAMPFCSTRCKQIDRAHWLNETYGLPIEPEEAKNVEKEEI